MATRDEIERAYEQGKGTSHFEGLKAVYSLGREDMKKVYAEDPVMERGYTRSTDEPEAKPEVKKPKAAKK